MVQVSNGEDTRHRVHLSGEPPATTHIYLKESSTKSTILRGNIEQVIIYSSRPVPRLQEAGKYDRKIRSSLRTQSERPWHRTNGAAASKSRRNYKALFNYFGSCTSCHSRRSASLIANNLKEPQHESAPYAIVHVMFKPWGYSRVLVGFKGNSF